MSADQSSDAAIPMCDDCYSGCFVGNCKDPHCECPECGGLQAADELTALTEAMGLYEFMAHLDKLTEESKREA